MIKRHYSLVLFILFGLYSCTREVPYTIYENDTLFGCLQSEGEYVIKSESTLKKEIHQNPENWHSEQVEFDGTQNSYTPKCTILDSDKNGKIDVLDYMQIITSTYFQVNYKNNIYTIPRILRFDKTGKYIYSENKDLIPANLIIKVDSINGKITFAETPKKGTLLGINPKKSILEANCPPEKFHFGNSIIIGKTTSYPCNCYDMDVKIIENKLAKTLTYQHKLLCNKKGDKNYSDVCFGFYSIDRKWVYIENVDTSYSVIFEEIK